MGGQNYVTMSLIISLTHGLAEGLEVSLIDSVDKEKFKRKILSKLESKFHINSLEPNYLPLLCYSVDPSFGDVQFLDTDEQGTSVKEALVEQLTEERLENELVMNEMQCDTSAPVKGSAQEASADIPGAKSAKLMGEIIKSMGTKP